MPPSIQLFLALEETFEPARPISGGLRHFRIVSRNPVYPSDPNARSLHEHESTGKDGSGERP